MADTREHDPRVDELRERLRSLGYLDAGVDRFVLAPARGSRRHAVIALLMSLRIGLLAAVLLGPAAAIGVAGRLPGLVTGPRDAIVIAIYMGALFGAAVMVAAFAASEAVGAIARRRSTALGRYARTWSTAAGVVVTIACLVYLTLWWQTTNAGLGWTAPLWTLFALGVATAISLLLGHAVALTALAVIVSRTTGGMPALDAAGPSASARAQRGRGRSPWLIAVAAGVLGVSGSAMLLVLTSDTVDVHSVPTLTVVPSGLRVRLYAIDGVDVRVFDELSRAGRLPAIAGVFDAASARLDAPDGGPPDPARTWTTIATGQPPGAHGVRGLETRRVAGVSGTVAVSERSALAASLHAATDLLRLTEPSVASGAERREKTFWEVASQAGLRTTVVNWWATWPASFSSGDVVLTDRATLRLEHGGELDAEIAPRDLYPQLKEQWPGIRQRASDMAGAALGATEGPARAILQRSAELDAIQLLLAEAVGSPAPDLLAVYLPGLDIAQHALLGAQQDGSPLAASEIAIRLEALKAYYVALDRLLARSLAPPNDDLVAIATASGRVSPSTAGRVGLRGAAAKPGAAISGTPVDLAPTILHALGVPISRALPGSPLLGLFDDSFTARYPVRYVGTYGAASVQPRAAEGQPLDREMIERLRSLGYVK